MAKLTLVIDDDVLRRARKRALDHGTSVNALLRQYLESYAARQERTAAVQRFLERAAAANVCSSSPWTREELHER